MPRGREGGGEREREREGGRGGERERASERERARERAERLVSISPRRVNNHFLITRETFASAPAPRGESFVNAERVD